MPVPDSVKKLEEKWKSKMVYDPKLGEAIDHAHRKQDPEAFPDLPIVVDGKVLRRPKLREFDDSKDLQRKEGPK